MQINLIFYKLVSGKITWGTSVNNEEHSQRPVVDHVLKTLTSPSRDIVLCYPWVLKNSSYLVRRVQNKEYGEEL